MAIKVHGQRGFTLVELLVALSVMAVLGLLSWRGLDGMARAQASVRGRMDGVVSLQIGLSQWSADLDAIIETGQVNGIDFDGRVVRLTRRDAGIDGSPLRVVGWTRRMIDGQGGAAGSWARWQSLPLYTQADLQQAWAQVQLWGQNPGTAEKLREVAIAGLDEWQVFYYRNNAWSNSLSTASNAAASGNPTTAGAGPAPASTGTLAPIPDGIRLVLNLSAGQPLSGTVVKDWIRPTLGGGKS
jgi:general secretion pathway protein J